MLGFRALFRAVVHGCMGAAACVLRIMTSRADSGAGSGSDRAGFDIVSFIDRLPEDERCSQCAGVMACLFVCWMLRVTALRARMRRSYNGCGAVRLQRSVHMTSASVGLRLNSCVAHTCKHCQGVVRPVF